MTDFNRIFFPYGLERRGPKQKQKKKRLIFIPCLSVSARRTWRELEGKTVEEAWKMSSMALPLWCLMSWNSYRWSQTWLLFPYDHTLCNTWRNLVPEGKLKDLHLKCFKTEMMSPCLSMTSKSIKNLCLSEALLEGGEKQTCTHSCSF